MENHNASTSRLTSESFKEAAYVAAHLKIAIHTRSGSFSEGWIEYCQDNNIPFKEVDCFADDIIAQLLGCDALLWHWPHHGYREVLFARQLIASVEAMGLVVFPNTATCWHYDDKVGQKYLLEAIGAPLVPSHVFYHKKRALEWLETATFPLVWKLRGGAGSQNVRLVHDLGEARRIVRRSFGRGWKPPRFYGLREGLRLTLRHPGRDSFTALAKGAVRAIIPHPSYRKSSKDRNYVYFQEFIPDNDCDIRVIVIGNRAFAIKRMTREGDFRASGSGHINHDNAAIPIEPVRIAFEMTKQLDSQSCAFDFVQDVGQWKIVEISYAFSLAGYTNCPGHWKRDMTWHPGPVRPEYFMVEDVLAFVNSGRYAADVP